MRFVVSLLLVASVSCLSYADEEKFASIALKVAPSGVSLGMHFERLKAVRPTIFRGPSAEDPRKLDGGIQCYVTFMEVEGIGNPGHTSYWYLLDNGEVVGIIKTLSGSGVDEDVHEKTTRSLFFELTASLGSPEQRSVVRRDGVSFSSVRADVWEDSVSGRKIFFVATNKEITIAVLSKSSFPVDQVFIKPNFERFPEIDASTTSLGDVERPSAFDISTGSVSTQGSSSQEISSEVSSALEPEEVIEVSRGLSDEKEAGSDVDERRSFFSSKKVFITLLAIGVVAILAISFNRRV